MELSVLKRLVLNHFPSVKLTVQYRMHPALSHFPNRHTYANLLQNAIETRTLTPRREFDRSLRQWLEISPANKLKKTNVIAVNVRDGLYKINEHKSRFNEENINVGVSLVIKLFEDGSLKPGSLMIITPYHAQRNLYLQIFVEISKKMKIPFVDLPTVHTCSSMLGREASEIIVDIPYANVDRLGNLGIMQNEELCNVTFTRARRSCIFLVNNAITSGKLAGGWRKQKDRYGRGIRENNPLLYLLDITNHLASAGGIYEKLGQTLAAKTFQEAAKLAM